MSDTDGRTASRARRLLVTAVQYAIAVVAFAWLLTQVDLGRVLALLGDVDALTVVALLGVTGFGLLARFYTWYAVMHPLQRVEFRDAASTDLAVNFVNQLLPSRLSGRVAAPFVLRGQTGMSYPDASAASGVHTGVYAVLYGLTSLFGLAVVVAVLPLGLVVVLALSTGLYLAAGAVVLLAGTNLTLLDRLVAALARLLAPIPRVGTGLADRVDALTEFTSSSAAAFRKLAGDPAVWLGYAVGWTGALVLAPGLRVWLLFGAFGVDFQPVLALPLVLVAAYSVTLLPLTPGGIGITEATATAVFVALGVPSAVVVPVVLVDRVLGVYLPALAGWYPSARLDLTALSVEE